MNVIKLFFVPLFFTIPIQSFPKPSLSISRHFINPITQNTSTNETEYFEVTQPLPTDDITPTCSINVLNHTFENTSTSNTTSTRLISVPYTPPPATCEWSHVVLDFQAQCKGELQHVLGIAGVWIDGVELLRTSMAQPNEYGVVFWNVRKDITRHSSVITQNNLTFSLMLENLLINEEFIDDVYYVNVSLLFYNDNAIKFPLSAVKGESLYPYETPADLIIPVSGGLDDEGFWFKIHNESDPLQEKSFLATSSATPSLASQNSDLVSDILATFISLMSQTTSQFTSLDKLSLNKLPITSLFL